VLWTTARLESARSPRIEFVTAHRDELHHLIDGLPDDQVEVLLAEARRLVADRPNGTWPPKYFGMIENGPTNGSSPEYVDSVLAKGFGSER
jgi:hypothetical protein